jgi:5-hydroxyisourate hydrolase-like protein (transthyretin family)
MDKFQIVRDKANERGLTFLAANDTELSTSGLYGPFKLKYTNTMLLMDAAKQKQFEETQDITFDKEYHRNLVGQTVWKFSNRGSAQAFSLNMPDLAKALDKSLYFILKGKAGEVYGKANNLYLKMKEYETELDEIEAADFTKMETMLKDFKKVLNAPKEEIKEKKTEGTDPIPGLLDEMDVIKGHIGKVIQSYFSHLYEAWLEVIKVGKPEAMRRTSLVAFITDKVTGVPMRKVKVTLKKGDIAIVKKTTKKGYVRFYSLESGNYTLIAEYPDYDSYYQDSIGLDDNHIEKILIGMRLEEVFVQAQTAKGQLSLTAFDKETGLPLDGVVVSIPFVNHNFTTAMNGLDFLSGLMPGNYQGMLYRMGYQTLSFYFTIEADKVTEVQLYLEKEVVA